MRHYCNQATLTITRDFAALACCPHCGDLMVAPLSSEFVETGEIRHHWQCDACGAPSMSSIPLKVR